MSTLSQGMAAQTATLDRLLPEAVHGGSAETRLAAVEAEVLTADAVRFLAALSERFEGRRKELLARRALRLAELKQGKLFDFLPETAEIRRAEWTVALYSPRSAGQACRDHRTGRTKDDH